MRTSDGVTPRLSSRPAVAGRPRGQTAPDAARVRAVVRTGTVARAMLTRPVVHAADTTVAEARAALLDPHRHLLLIVDGRRLLGTVDRGDLRAVQDAAKPALTVARLSGRTVRPDVRLVAVHAAMRTAGQRRRAVVDDGVLLGLLCLKASGAGFCSDAGLETRRSGLGPQLRRSGS